MKTIKEEIMSIAEAQGYEGEGGSTIAEAVNALGSVMGDYELPAATATTLGGVKVGDGLSVTNDGTLSASGGGGGGGYGMVVTITLSNGTFVADKTIDEVIDYLNAGNKDLIAVWDPSNMGYSGYLYFPFLSAPASKDVTFARLVPLVHAQRGQSGAVQSIEVDTIGIDVFYYDNSGLKHDEYRVEDQLVKVNVTMSSDGTSATTDIGMDNKKLYTRYNEGALIYFIVDGAVATNCSISLTDGNYYVSFFVLSDDGTSLKATKFTQSATTATNRAYTVTQLS